MARTSSRARQSTGLWRACYPRRDRATGRDPPPRGTERLPARAGGQGRGRHRPPPDLVRPARARAATRSSTSAARVPRPRPARPRSQPIADWARRLRVEHGEGRGAASPSTARPTRAIGSSPSRGPARSGRRRIAEAAVALAERDVSSGPAGARLTGTQRRPVARWAARIARRGRRRRPGSATRTAACRSCRSRGTNGKSTMTRLITHILARGRPARRHDDVGWRARRRAAGRGRRLDRPGWRPSRSSAARDVDVAVLETARGGLLLRGIGYESNDASVADQRLSDHIDLQGIHTLPELAEVKSTICRITRPDGWVVLNADDPLVAAVARRVRRRVALFTLARRPPRRSSRATSQRGGRAYLVRDGLAGRGSRATTRRPIVDGRRRPDHARRAGPPQRRQCAGRGRRRRGRWAPRSHEVRRRPRRLRADAGRVARPAQPLPARRRGS